MFLIISRLLADPLGPSSQLIFETADGTHPTSITPPVSLGKYKLKLNQLNDVCRELWDKAILLNCETVRFVILWFYLQLLFFYIVGKNILSSLYLWRHIFSSTSKFCTRN